jgi:hypothetical protein
MVLSTLGVAADVTPSVIETFFSHASLRQSSCHRGAYTNTTNSISTASRSRENLPPMFRTTRVCA